MNFNNILIGSEDPARLADYYTKLFGEPAWNEGGYVGWHDRVGRRQRRAARRGQGAQRASRPASSGTSRAATSRAISIASRRPARSSSASRMASRGAGRVDRHVRRPDDNYFQLTSPMG